MLRYVRARRRQVYHSMVLAEFEKSGITQAELARRIGKSPRRVNAWLSNPSNWESDTVADLLFAATGTVDVPFAVEPAQEAHARDRMTAESTSAARHLEVQPVQLMGPMMLFVMTPPQPPHPTGVNIVRPTT
jgi:transcriptional regulator with XRE-family HTH domain